MSLESQDVKLKQENSNGLGVLTSVDTPNSETQGPKNFGGPLPSFKWLCEKLLDKLESFHRTKFPGKGILESKIQVIRVFFAEWRLVVGPNVYPVLILILPHLDKDRVYGCKDDRVVRKFLEIIKIPHKSKDWEYLMKWKQQKGTKGQRLSTVLVETLKKRQVDVKGGNISISELNDMLDKLADRESRKEMLGDILTTVIQKMSFLELQYFFDILLKKNMIRSMEQRILYEWHPDAPRYLSVVTSLKTLAYKLYDPNIRLNNDELTVTLSKPFAPQLSKKPLKNYDQIVELLAKDFFIEEKMDGERVQVHWVDRGESTHYYSRKATDYSYLYGSSKNNGCISPHLNFPDNVVSCVLDGEMVTYDPVKNVLLPFGVLKGSAIRELERLGGVSEDPTSARPLLVVFDILYLNGSSLANIPLVKRKHFLEKVLIPEPKFVEIIKAERVDNVESIKDALNHAIELGSEGIILKKADTKYYLDKRNDFWLKLKPEYLEEFGESIDLLVIGREKSRKDMFYVGLRIIDNDDETTQIPHFWSFARIANGFDQSDYRKVDELTKGKWKESSKDIPPSSLLEFGSRVPPEWIHPEDSFVIEVKARSIVKSDSGKYRTQSTLYNAYCRQIREDKSWKTTLTWNEYSTRREERRSTTAKDHKLLTKKKRLEDKRKRAERDEEKWNRYDVSFVSDIFKDLIFIILTDCYHNKERMTIEEITTIINKNGSFVTKSQSTVTKTENLRIISDKITIEAKELYHVGYDILKSNWIFDCLYQQKIVQIEPKHCLLVSEKMKEVANSRVNDIGVSYTTPISIDDLTKVLDRTAINDNIEIREDLQSEIELFGGLKVYIIHSNDGLNIEFRLLKVKLEGFGAKVVDSIDNCNYVVVVNDNDNDNEDDIYSKVKSIRKKIAMLMSNHDDEKGTVSTIRIVNERWVDDSIQEGTRVDPQDYNVPLRRYDNSINDNDKKNTNDLQV